MTRTAPTVPPAALVGGSLSTKEGWSRFCAATPPARPQLPDRPSLDPTARTRLDRARKRWHSNPPTLTHRQHEQTTERLRRLLAANAELPDDGTGRQALLIDGPAGMGKSHILKDIAREHHHARLAELDPLHDGDGDEYETWPVCYVSLPGKVGAKGLCDAVLDFYAVPHARGWTSSQLQSAAVRAMRGFRTDLLVLDDVHHLADADVVAVIDVIRRVQNDVAVTMVGAGVRVRHLRLMEARLPMDQQRFNQFAQRTDLHPVDFYGRDRSDVLEWRRLLRHLDRHTVLYDHRVGDLDALTARTLDRCEGGVNRLLTFYRKATELAVTSGEERITEGLAGRVLLDSLSETGTVPFVEGTGVPLPGTGRRGKGRGMR